MSTTTNNANRAETVARACYQAYVDKDRARIEALLADDFSFTSPLDNALNRETYLQRCWPNSAQMKSFDFISVAPDGNGRVFVVYEATTSDGRRFRNTERLTVRNDKLVEVEVYFGWSIPHEAKPGGFVEQGEKDLASHGDPEQDKRQIRDLVHTWMEATKQGDADKILDLMTDDVLFLLPGKPPMDKPMFEKQARAQSSASGPAVEGKSEIEELIVCGDWAITRSRLEVTMTPRDGSPAVRRAGYAMTVFRKQGTTWRLARDANLLAPAST